MRARQGIVAAALLAVLLPRALPACDSSACLLVTRGQSGVLPRGVFTLDLSFRKTDEGLRLEGSRRVGSVPRPKVDFENQRLRPGYHDDLGGSDSFAQLDAGYGLTSRLSLSLSVSLFSERAYDIGHVPVQRENFTTRGNGDLLLGARYAARAGPGSLVAGLGVELPTGRHDLESPPGRVERGILDPMLQPGSGSWDLLASAQYSLSWPEAGLDWTLGGSYQANGENGLAYAYGDIAIASATASRALGSRLRASLQLKGVVEGRSRYLDAAVPSTGSKLAYLTPGLTFAAFRKLSLYVFLPLPVYRYVNEAQLAPRPAFVVGVSRSFSF